MNQRSVKCDCGAIVSAEGKATLDSVTCDSCGTSIVVTPRRLNETRVQPTSASRPNNTNKQEHFDVFISHASEDKDDLARPLAAALEQRGLRVWSDESQLSLGDSIRRNIDRALAQSRFGVVLVSQHFMSKEWPNRELDGFIARADGRMVALPVRHGITHAQLEDYSPTLADRVSVSSEVGVEEIADRIYRAVKHGYHQAVLAVADPGVTIDSIRRAILLGPGRPEMKRYLYEVERYLSGHPDNVDARMLKDMIEEAIHHERGRPQMHRRAMPLGWRITLFVLWIIGGIGLYDIFRPSPVPITVATSPGGNQLIVASAQRTEIRFVLRWENENDLDLSVIDPSGVKISYATPVTKTGRLDHDVTVGPGEETIRIDTRPPGTYRVIVNDFSAIDTPEFKLTVVVGGEVRKTYVGNLEEGRRTYTLDLDLIP